MNSGNLMAQTLDVSMAENVVTSSLAHNEAAEITSDKEGESLTLPALLQCSFEQIKESDALTTLLEDAYYEVDDISFDDEERTINIRVANGFPRSVGDIEEQLGIDVTEIGSVYDNLHDENSGYTIIYTAISKQFVLTVEAELPSYCDDEDDGSADFVLYFVEPDSIAHKFAEVVESTKQNLAKVSFSNGARFISQHGNVDVLSILFDDIDQLAQVGFIQSICANAKPTAIKTLEKLFNVSLVLSEGNNTSITVRTEHHTETMTVVEARRFFMQQAMVNNALGKASFSNEELLALVNMALPLPPETMMSLESEMPH